MDVVERMKSKNFNNGYGFYLSLLIDIAGAIGEMLKEGKLTQVVRCKDCKYFDGQDCKNRIESISNEPDWFCADGERK